MLIESSQQSTAPRVGLWIIAGFVSYLVVGVASLFVVAWFTTFVIEAQGIDAGAGTIGLSIRNAVHPIVWGVATALAALPIGRRLIPEMRPSPPSWSLLGAGLALAALTTFLVLEFVRARYGYFDPEYTGFTVFTAPAIVAISLAAWATLAVPRGHGLFLAATTVTGVAGLALSLLPSVEGARDGIDAANIPLVVVLGLDVAYAAVVSLAVVRRVIR